MSGPLPDWVAAATAPSEAEVSSFLDAKQPDLVKIASSATEPLRDEVQSLIRRCASQRDERIRWSSNLILPRRALLLALVALVILGASAVGWRQALLAPIPRVAQVHYATDGRGSWTERSRDASGVSIEQVDGVVRYQVDPLPAGQHLRVRARAVEVEVVGTVFEVGIEHESIWVEVLEGKVRVSNGAFETLLAAGESWRGQGRAEMADARRAPQMILSSSPLPPPLPPERAAPVVQADDSADRIVAATSLDAVQPADANQRAASYAALLGRVDSGERSEALVTALEAFAAESEGPLSDAALVTAIEVATDVRPPEAVIGTIDWFLDTRPRTVHRKHLLEMQGDLARNRMQSCERALPSYRELAGTSSGAQQARAEALRGLCAASIGRVDEARAALLSSLQLGIDLPLWSEVHAALDALE